MSDRPLNKGSEAKQRGEMHPLALRPKAAAKALGIGERLLWSTTKAGEIPHLRIGKAIVYPVAALERWLAKKAEEVNQ